MFAIEGYEHALVFTSKGQHRLIRNTLPGVACIESGQHVMPVLTQYFDTRLWKVFVGVDPRHVSGHFIVEDGALNLVRVEARVGPGMGQIFGAQRGIAA